MKGRFFKWILVLAVVLVGASAADAQQSDGTVTVDQLRVRATPGTNAPVIGMFSYNTAVTLSGREDQEGNGGVWVLASNGSLTGWVLVDYLQLRSDLNVLSLPVVSAEGSSSAAQNTQFSEQVAPAAGGASLTAVVLQDANVRSGPGTNFTRVGGALAGSDAILIGRSADSSWLRGNFGGTDGWLAVGLVRANGSILTLPPTDEQITPASAPPPASAGSVPPPPLSGRINLAGFSYGAHIAGFNGTERMSAIGMTWIKTQVRYHVGDDPNGYAGIIGEAHARGFRVLLGVVGSPSDVAAGGEGYFQQFANFTAGLAALGADAIEVWNEPNLDREWPTGMVDPAMYTRLLAIAYNAIKTANPNTIVISGAPAPTGFFGGCSPNGCDDSVYVDGMSAAGAASYMDCMGAHYNEGIVPPQQTSGDPRSEFYTRYLFGMINTYSSKIGRPLCFTELGYVTPDGYGPMPPGFEWGNQNTIQEQAQWLADALSLSAQSGKVRLVIIWNFNFYTPAGTPDPAGGYAMLRPDGTCPACDAIAAR